MRHPACCKDPNCTLSYRDHLVGFGLSANAIPTRAINRTIVKDSDGKVIGKQPDEPVTQTLIREKRWERDMESYKRLYEQGYRPPSIDGAALRERASKTDYDINHRPVKIDYSDPS